jgi:hypothetical protein
MGGAHRGIVRGGGGIAKRELTAPAVLAILHA